MKKISLAALLMVVTTHCFAAGMVPETSVLLVDESKGEASMNVTNTDSRPALLYTRIVELPDGHATTRLVATQPVVRVEPGEIQRVRFMLQNPTPMQHQEMKRVTFEGIPQKEKGKNQLAITVRQDLPVIIHPARLAEDLEPWRHLSWQKKGTDIEVTNPSKYVVRLAHAFTTQPSGKEGILPATYLLPGARVTVKLPTQADTSVTFYPASRYGYQGASYTTALR